MVLETLIKLCVAEPDFLEKLFGPRIGKMGQNRVFEFKEKFGSELSLKLFYNGNLYYLLCPAQVVYLGKNLVPEI